MIKVDMVSIPIKDSDRALKFYTEKLGCKLITDEKFDEDKRWIELSIPNSETRIALFTPDGQEDRIGTFSNVIFGSKDVQKSYEELKDKGVSFMQPPKEESWGVCALFNDSEGNTFCLSQKS